MSYSHRELSQDPKVRKLEIAFCEAAGKGDLHFVKEAVGKDVNMNVRYLGG